MSLFYALFPVTSTNNKIIQNSLSPQTLQPIAEDEGQFRAMEVAQTNPPGQAIAEVKDIEKGWKT